MALDPVTYGRYLRAVDKAKRHGMALVEVLDRDRLLLTPERKHAIESEIAKEIYLRFEKQSASKLMQYFIGRESGTPEDMYRATLEWLEVLVRAVMEKTLEED